jgi:2-desacetyl-2-hydroxyethyl bacteriochlorophyllide A dehydrogenase
MNRRTVTITGPRKVELREEALPPPGENEALVESLCSAISAGTELLIYRGEFPKALEDLHDRFSSGVRYPWPCGYACIGRILGLGPALDPALVGRLVFSFQPHTTHFIAPLESLFFLPEGQTPESACFLPNMETAVNLAQDAAPLLGERVLVLGQGVVGLLTASLLREFPLHVLVSADLFPLRRKASPAPYSLDPASPEFREQARALLEEGADLTFELSGHPGALDEAIALTRFTGRIIIGSWYGEKRVPLDLGGSFHRSRLKLISSQVSSIAPELSSRWDKTRRFDVAWEALLRLHPEQWITHHFPIERAPEAFRLLDESPAEALQVVFDY